MPFEILAFPAPLCRSLAVHRPDTPKIPGQKSHQSLIRSLPTTIDNPLVWLPLTVTADARHTASLNPRATLLTLLHLCEQADLANLTALLLEAPLDIPACDDLAEFLAEVDAALEQAISAYGINADVAARRQLLVARLAPVVAALTRLQPLVDAAQTAVDEGPEAGLPYLQTVMQRHAAGDTATALAAYTRKRTQRDLQRSIARRARRDGTTADDLAHPETMRTLYKEFRDAAQADGVHGGIGALRPAGWLGTLTLLIYAEALCGGLLAAALYAIINPGD